jgi:molecular chaperone DnaJ
MKEQGIPRLDGHGRGSLIVLVQVDVPKQLTERAKGLLAELDAELRGSVASGPQATSQATDTRKRVAAAK